MNISKKSHGSKRIEHWRQMIEQWKTSGLSQAEFCRQNSISSGNFSTWRQRLTKENHSTEPVTFAPVKIKSVPKPVVATSPQATPLILQLKNDAKLFITSHTDLLALKMLLELLGVTHVNT